MTRLAAGAGLVVGAVLVLGACLGPIPPPMRPCPETTAGEFAVTSAEQAVEAVRVHLADRPSAFDLNAPEVSERDREWYVAVPRRPGSDESADSAPGSIPFRVCKANGEVENALRL